MAVVTRKKRKRILFIVIPFLIIIVILCYYQLLYKSPRVDNGIARLQMIFDKHRHIVTAVRFMPGDSLVVTSSVDSTIKIWKISSGEIVKEIKQPSGIAYMDLSAGGKYAVTGGYDSTVRLWSIDNGELIREFKGHSGTVWCVAISADN